MGTIYNNKARRISTIVWLYAYVHRSNGGEGQGTFRNNLRRNETFRRYYDVTGKGMHTLIRPAYRGGWIAISSVALNYIGRSCKSISG